MAKRKVKKTLTKIDPSILKPKPQAISQHAADDGIRVTTTVEPVYPPVAPDPLLDPAILEAIFDAETSDLTGDEDFDDGVSRGYYVARVCVLFPLLPSMRTHRH